MFKEKYQVEEVSSTRIVVWNKSFWCTIKKETIIGIVENLNAKGRQVSAVFKFANKWNGFDYWIVTLPKDG